MKPKRHVYTIPGWARIIADSGGPRLIPLQDNETDLAVATKRLNAAVRACDLHKLELELRLARSKFNQNQTKP